MSTFAKAHAMTKRIIQAGDNYAATFALCLKVEHKKAKFVVCEFGHSRAYIADKTTLFTTYAQAKAYVESLPEFACAAIEAPNYGGTVYVNYPNPYMPLERQAAIAFDAKQSNWKSLMNKF